MYTGTGIGAGDRSCIHEQGQDQGTGGGYNMYIMYTRAGDRSCIQEQDTWAKYRSCIQEPGRELRTGVACIHCIVYTEIQPGTGTELYTGVGTGAENRSCIQELGLDQEAGAVYRSWGMF